VKKSKTSLLPNCSNCGRFQASWAASISFQLLHCDKVVRPFDTRQCTDFLRVLADSAELGLRIWLADRVAGVLASEMHAVGSKTQRAMLEYSMAVGPPVF
jgi:hypothetical protein